MTITEALSDRHITALLDATEIGKDKLGGEFFSASVKNMLKSGYTAVITDKSGVEHRLSVKHDGRLKIISFV